MIDNEKMDRALLDLGFTDVLRGTAYVRSAVKCWEREPGAWTKEIYPAVARIHGTTAFRVERSIRYAIGEAFARADMDAVQRVFGWSIDPARGYPTVSEFVSRMAVYACAD